MKITKFGHCCLLIEEQGKRIITDPGMFTAQQNEQQNIDAILITHEHGDHFHIPYIQKIIENNPKAIVITNTSVAELISKEGLDVVITIVEHGQSVKIGEVLIEGFGKDHALFHSSIPAVQNTGYLVAEKLFFPGDAFPKLSKAVEILALPVAGPWMKISEAIDYALALKPRIAFPVHDGILIHPNMMATWLGQILPKHGIEYKMVEIDKQTEF